MATLKAAAAPTPVAVRLSNCTVAQAIGMESTLGQYRPFSIKFVGRFLEWRYRKQETS